MQVGNLPYLILDLLFCVDVGLNNVLPRLSFRLKIRGIGFQLRGGRGGGGGGIEEWIMGLGIII